MTATEDEVDETIIKNIIDKLNSVLGIEEKENKYVEKSDSFEDFYKSLKEIEIDSNTIYFCKIIINKNSPLPSARAFMILTSLKGKENLICSSPKLENFSNKLFELHEEYIHILFSSENDISHIEEYLASFPKVDEVKVIDTNDVDFSFDKNKNSVEGIKVEDELNYEDDNNLIEDNLIEISSLDEITDIIEYI